MDLDRVRLLVRDKLERGDLPREKCQVTWFGRGSGECCAACGAVIEPRQVECECEHPRGDVIRFHQGCFALWDEARQSEG